MTVTCELPCPPGFDLSRSQRLLRWGTGDPTLRLSAGAVERASLTPAGPASYRLTREADRVKLCAYGDGASWLAERAADLVGLSDRPEEFSPRHQGLGELARRFSGIHLPRTHTVYERLLPAVVHQLVKTTEAVEAFRKLVWRFGSPAPGLERTRLVPEPSILARLPVYQLQALGIGPKQARTLQEVALKARWLGAAATLPPEQAARRLMALRGVGPWTAHNVLGKGLGYPDAVPVGDYNLPSQVAWALAGEARADDRRMLQLLEPYRGHRFRVIYLLKLAGIRAPRFGPRAARRPR